MRHTLASQLLRNGISLPVISETLGHKTTQTTMGYLRIDIDGLMKCVLKSRMSHPISTHRKEVCSMSEQFIYQSVFAPYFKDFLAMKENQVSDIGRIKWMLLEFDKFFVNSNIRDVFITKSMIDTWKCTRIHDKRKPSMTRCPCSDSFAYTYAT